MIQDIIETINGSVRRDLDIKGSKFFGIAELLPTAAKDATVLIPTVIGTDGEGNAISPEKYTFQVYHRISSKSSQLNRTQYGAGNKKQTDTYNATVFVIADRTKIKMGGVCLGERLSEWFPDLLVAEGSQILITQGNMNFDTAAIMRQEFPSADYGGMPDVVMISMDYQIIYEHQRRCKADRCHPAGDFSTQEHNQDFYT